MILDKIKAYLSLGGLFNPELMEHEKVRDLIIDCREEITALKAQLKAEREVVDFYADKKSWQLPADQGFKHSSNGFDEDNLMDMIDNDDDGIVAGKRAREQQAKRRDS